MTVSGLAFPISVTNWVKGRGFFYGHDMLNEIVNEILNMFDERGLTFREARYVVDAVSIKLSVLKDELLEDTLRRTKVLVKRCERKTGDE